MRVISSLQAMLVLAACSGPAPQPSAIEIHTSDSGALLFVDARPLGPVRDGMEVPVTPGDHVLELRRDDHVIAMSVVSVAPGERAHLALEPDPRLAGAPLSPTAPLAAPGPPALPPPPAPSPVGHVRLVATPAGASVLEAGIELGRTPLELDLRPGAHTLELRAAGHITTSIEVEVAEGGSSVLSVVLQRDGSDGDDDAQPLPETRSPSDVQRVIAGARRGMQRCYEPEPGEAGTQRAQLELTIAPDGSVTRAEVTGVAPSLASCLTREARALAFPPAATPTTVSFPLLFTSAGR